MYNMANQSIILLIFCRFMSKMVDEKGKLTIDLKKLNKKFGDSTKTFYICRIIPSHLGVSAE